MLLVLVVNLKRSGEKYSYGLFPAHEVKEIKEESIINNVHVPEEEYTGNSGMRVPLLVSLAAAAAVVALVGAASRSRRWR